jgi:adenylate cyclase
MRESAERAALRRIQDIVSDATGISLPAAAEKPLLNVLSGLAGTATHASVVENFSQRNVSILVSDLRGFTALSGSHPAGTVLQMLNQCFVSMSESIVRHQGTIDKFTGDSIMAIFFGTAEAPNDHVRRALACAVDMQIAMQALNARNKHLALPELYMGIGVNTGSVMAGLVGDELYSAYALIGEDVSLASRIEAFSLRGQVLISESTHAIAKDHVQTGEPMEVYVKGRSERMVVRELLAIPALGKVVPRQEIRRSPRIPVTLPLSYQMVRNKIVLPQRQQATVVDIGYHGVCARLQEAPALYSEMKLELDLPLVMHHLSELYARVVTRPGRDEDGLAGLEFTSLSAESNRKLQLFVQMLLQGQES